MTSARIEKRKWSKPEELFLTNNADNISFPTLCTLLGRSEASVRSKAYRMNKLGSGIHLNSARANLTWCPQCATWRTKLYGKSGLCPVCRAKELLKKYDERLDMVFKISDSANIEKLLAASTLERITYPPKPEMPQPRGKGKRNSKREEYDHLVKMEKWEIDCIRRKINAKKARLTRLREGKGRARLS
ncbi:MULTISPECIES: hypothetical protein [unclassified Gordonibacter]|uniref:hypothetical protein n=1 Tax=unclassified Gordonibacter TaxID=2634373 RepID=UPI001124292E|nr:MULTISPECIES: hypothetical protein [unclassified Gordonibacter]MDN4508834.1 hypothetical protein [Gordonibacter sp. RACS_AR49]